jgi:hypothetical protein
MRPKFVLGFLLLAVSTRTFCQVAPSATRGGIPGLSIGAGISDYNPDLGQGRMFGTSVWIDYALKGLPKVLQGTGLELEGRDISFGRSSPKEAILREDSFGGGATYTLLNLGPFRPYAKLIFGLGNADYLISPTRRYNQQRTLTCFGGGFDVKAYRAVWVRVDYEYQYFPDFFKGTKAKPLSAPLDPQGFTLGAVYHFGRKDSER